MSDNSHFEDMLSNKNNSLIDNFISAITKYKNILIYIKGSPDPDAIASSLAIKLICEKLDIKAHIYSPVNLSLPQNSEFVKLLDIPIKFGKKTIDFKKYDSYVITDHQSAKIDDENCTLPCSLHIDHHDKIKENIKIDYTIISQNVGSASTIIALMIMNLDLDFTEDEIKQISTALLYGIQTDTDKYEHANKIDYRAMNYLSQFTDNSILQKISNITLSDMALKSLAIAISKQIIYKDWLISGIGIIDELDRDNIAIIADFLLKREDVSVVIIFAGIKGSEDKLYIDASFRTEKVSNNLNEIIKLISKNGGARKYKGAYRIDLGYLYNCPDKDILWDVISQSTIETLKKQRDNFYITEIKGFYKKFKSRISDIFQ